LWETLLGRNDLLHAAVLLPQRPRHPAGDTPIMGEGAVERWIALHDRARDVREALHPGDSVGERQVQRAEPSSAAPSAVRDQEQTERAEEEQPMLARNGRR
jgi:hypothetical protein